VTGYYNNPTQEGVLLHYKTLSAETDAKIVLYNVPCRTLSYIEPQTVIELADDKNIIGMKQAVNFSIGGEHHADTVRIAQATKDKDFALISGEDDSFFSMLEIGGKALITATGNIPEAVAQYLALKNQFDAGETQKAFNTQKALLPLINLCFSFKNPIPLGTCFNSPLYQPMISVKDTINGQERHLEIMETIKKEAPSLLDYHK